MMTFDKQKVETLLAETPVKGMAIPDSVHVYYGGWSLKELRSMRPDLFHEQTWFDNEAFADAKGEPGMYLVTLRIPNSNSKSFEEQCALLKEGVPCPLVLAATAIALQLAENPLDPLGGDIVRCADALPGGCRAGLDVLGGRVDVRGGWDDYRFGDVFLGAARKF